METDLLTQICFLLEPMCPPPTGAGHWLLEPGLSKTNA